MKNIKTITMALVCIMLFSATSLMARSRAKRVILISLDGISIQGFKQAQTPHLDSLLSQGALSLNTRAVMPSITLPNWTSHLTGSGPEQHGVTDNGWEYNKRKLEVMIADEDGYYPSLFYVMKKNLPKSKIAFYYNWKNLIYPYNLKYFDEVSFQQNDGYAENFDKAYEFIKENRALPTLVYLYSVHTDHAGHNKKWMSTDYIQSIENADEQIGILINKLKESNLYKDTYFMFLSDHGGKEYSHGGLSEDEMIVPWGIVGPKIKKGFEITEPNNTINTSSTVLNLFNIDQPTYWLGRVPTTIYK